MNGTKQVSIGEIVNANLQLDYLTISLYLLVYRKMILPELLNVLNADITDERLIGLKEYLDN